MATAKTTLKACYTRNQAALLLSRYLGPYDWRKDLTCATERTREHRGYRQAGVVLYPRCIKGVQPFYEESEVFGFIRTMMARFPELHPSGLHSFKLTIPAKDKRKTDGPHGFRLNKAQLTK